MSDVTKQVAKQSNRIAVEERLFSLVLALLASHTGLTRREILETVQGYRQQFNRSGGNASLERQFERDKDDIRDLGVPLEVIDDPADSGNNQAMRYRISKGAYDLPAHITFSAEEVTLLSLAAMVWREGSLSADSRRAITKLRSLGIESNEPVLGYAPRLRVRETAFDPLNQALERHQIVTFNYLKSGEAEPSTRTVAPLALVQHDGRWHMNGLDSVSDQVRTFLLSRIVGPVRSTGRTHEDRGDGHAHRVLTELDELWASHLAEVEVVPGTDAEMRLSKRAADKNGHDKRLRIHFSDEDVLADELTSYGPEVLVISPARLRQGVRERLSRLCTTHTDAPDSAPPALGTHEGAAHENAGLSHE